MSSEVINILCHLISHNTRTRLDHPLRSDIFNVIDGRSILLYGIRKFQSVSCACTVMVTMDSWLVDLAVGGGRTIGAIVPE